MNVISFKKIRDFYEVHPDAKTYLTAWFKTVKRASWKDFNAVKKDFRTVDMVGDSRLIFNIKGNHYRLIARISYEHKRLMIKWLGTHAEYDKIDAVNVE
ncbi:type II toxin-antitoxin system HigB family toxin [Dyadobacter sandarakinus]|uniref:Type II toxin-antitoxin system HigB family toxin n=1 Tax=Dyadobacter sandarakinus TaxID=2747268 RepID=A0ABX7I7N0_9BACT|nr:type II toxin-antitoxin system HigB family toxin [Dyadobacter sandarakinus]QRR02102.1 type II toxin-antitoxin system HigB family toxin [Dyadobacter sandarakinus]